MTILIIEDEPRTAKDLKGMLESMDSEIVVTAIISSVAAGLKWFKEHGLPDLIFSDIQLTDGLSFEIFRTVQLSVPVIFCTAYDQYAITAFEANGIDYLLKPLEEEIVERSLRKYKQMKAHLTGNQPYTVKLEHAFAQLAPVYKQSLLVHYREKMIPIRTGDIGFIYASGGGVFLHTITKEEYVVHSTIDQLEIMLNPQNFFRANRQFIISRDIIQNIEHYFNRRLVVHTKCPTPDKIVVSRLRVQDFFHWIEK